MSFFHGNIVFLKNLRHGFRGEQMGEREFWIGKQDNTRILALFTFFYLEKNACTIKLTS
jgi:hypothetical protein